MILWAGKPKSEDEPEFKHLGIRSWRWVFYAEPWIIGFEEQWRHSVDDRGWHAATRYYVVNITKWFDIGRDHMYYDGPHDTFSIGYLHFAWSGDWCEKCAGEATK